MQGAPSTTAQDQQVIDNKVKGIVAMQKSGQAQPKPEEKEKPKAAAGGASLLDKVEQEAAKQEAAQPTQDKPAETPAPAPAPAEGAAPAPAPAK